MNDKECFVIGCWVDNKIKEENLVSVIKDIKAKYYPVCLVAHYPVSTKIQELVDFYIFEKENVLSDNWRLNFWRMNNGVRQEASSLVDYHGVACLMNIRNAVDLLLAKCKFKYIHYREADLEYDFDTYMEAFRHALENDKQALFVHYQDQNYRTDLFSANINWYNRVIPRAESWAEYTTLYPDGNYILEYWFTHQVQKDEFSSSSIYFLDNFAIGNKWTQSNNVDWDRYDNPRPALDFADAPQNMFSSERKDCFIKAVESLYKISNPNIVEVGVTRFLDDHGRWSDGDSTSIWAWFISKYGGSYHGCDISPDSLKVAETILRQYITGKDKSSEVALTKKDGLEFLKNYNKPIDLLYLDSVDYEKGSYESGLYHLNLLIAAIDKITVNGIVMFDDTFNIDTFEGKAEIAIPYLLGNNNFTCILRGYQFIFRRDI